MGIDLATVRYVVHWNMPKTIEGFYQESGRAGRDGKRSESVLYYSKDDARKYAFFINNNNSSASRKNDPSEKLEALSAMIEYCIGDCGCRRKYLLAFFGERGKNVCAKTCDYCMDPKGVSSTINTALAAGSGNATVASFGADKPPASNDGAIPVGDYDSFDLEAGNDSDNDDQGGVMRDSKKLDVFGSSLDFGLGEVGDEDSGGSKNLKKKPITANLDSFFAKYSLEEAKHHSYGKGRTKNFGQSSYTASSTSKGSFSAASSQLHIPALLRKKITLSEHRTLKTNTFESIASKPERSSRSICEELTKLEEEKARAINVKQRAGGPLISKKLPLPPPPPPPPPKFRRKKK